MVVRHFDDSNSACFMGAMFNVSVFFEDFDESVDSGRRFDIHGDAQFVVCGSVAIVSCEVVDMDEDGILFFGKVHDVFEG